MLPSAQSEAEDLVFKEKDIHYYETTYQKEFIELKHAYYDTFMQLTPARLSDVSCRLFNVCMKCSRFPSYNTCPHE